MKTSELAIDYHIERLCDTRLADVAQLHAAVYGIIPSPDFFTRKYETGFTGVKHIGFIAYNKRGAPIAFYGVIPCYLRINEEIVLAAQSADTMTHLESRNKGLFVELARQTIELCDVSGIRLIFGFPNQNSLPGFINKLGWQMTERMDCFIIRSALFPWRRIFNKVAFLRSDLAGYRQNLLKKYAVNQQGLSNSVFGDGFAGVYRDDHYRNYKTYTDTQIIKIGNTILWIKIDDVLLIGDMVVEPRGFGETVDRLKKLAAAMGIKEIHFHASPGTTLHGLFAKDYKPIHSFPVIFKNFDEAIRTDNIKFSSADIDTF